MVFELEALHDLSIGERYHFKLPDGTLPIPDESSSNDSQPPHSPPRDDCDDSELSPPPPPSRDDKGLPIILRNNPDGTSAHSDPFTPRPDPDPRSILSSVVQLPIYFAVKGQRNRIPIPLANL